MSTTTELAPTSGPRQLTVAPGRALAKRHDFGAALPPFPPNAMLDAPAPRTRWPALFGLTVFSVFVVGFGAWSVMAPLAEAAIAPGIIKVEGNRRTVQHLEGGIVREILVRDGAKVQAGQVLVRLDDIQSDSTAEAQRAQRWALMAQDARLVAEMGKPGEPIEFPPELLESPSPRARDAVRGQREVYEARTASLNSQLQVLRARIEQQQAAIRGAQGQMVATRNQLVLIRQEERMRQGLVAQGLARLPDLLALQRAMAGLEGTIQELTGQIDRANATIGEAERQIQQALDQRIQEVSTELREVRGKLAETEERLRASSDVQTRRDILAPESGTVVNLKLFTLGAVVRPGDTILDIVPDSDRLVAEVNIQPSDIDVVFPGLKSEVRLPAFKQRLVPFLHGEVTWVAADVTTNDQTRQQYYPARIMIDREQMEKLPNVFLTPGMPVEAHVQIGERSFFRYMTQPIRDSFARAFREQ
ncbi:HlyD family type I secretion periplasmic adaptor subunit [Craurococcus roseus]|uniref:Membrane fusion protein (MFP) family protein n=1 Tax=Craurococcus roseus TaxID=77585 RepID=A0ABP3RBH0_9PROT